MMKTFPDLPRTPRLQNFILTFGLILGPIGACHKESSTSSVSSADETQCQSSLALLGEDQPAYDFVFPEGIAAYEAGTRVFQLKTGRTYECKGFPYTPYCRQWTAESTRFEPGTGSNWMAAWDLK